MADRIIHFPSTAGDPELYAIFRDRADGKVYDGTATLATWVDGNIASYDVALTFLGGDAYGLTVPANLPVGKTYLAATYRRSAVGAVPAITDLKLPDEWEFHWTGTVSDVPDPGDADWYYADQQDVEDLIGDLNLGIVFDLNADGTIDAGAVQRAGEWSDGYIDLALSAAGLDTPYDLSDAGHTSVLASISAHLAAWYGFHHRGLQELSAGRTDGIAGIMSGYKEHADEQLAKLIGVLQAADADDDATQAGNFSFVPIVRTCVSSSDENSA